jgi:hypothetical protein
MAKGVDIVVVGDDGSVAAEGTDARYRLRNSAGRYRILSDTPGLLVLRRVLAHEEASGASSDDLDDLDDLEQRLTEDSSPIEVGGRVVFAGEILSPMTLFQVIEIVAERGFVGEMQVFSSGGRWFQLTIDRGNLLHARSNDPADRLGEVLVRHNVLDRAELATMLEDVTANHRLGQVCLDRAVVDPERLFALLGNQIAGIFLRTLTVGDGAFVFSTPDPTQPPPDHTVHLSVRALLMDGVRRLDEIEIYRRLIPGNDVRLRAVETPRTGALDADALAVLARCDGATSLGDIARALELDEFSATRAAYFLVKSRNVVVVSRDRIDEAEVRRLAALFSEILGDVFTAISGAGGLDQAQQMLGAWVDGSGYGAVLGTGVASSGRIDPQTVLATVRAAREDDPLATFMHVAHELVSFALFCAGSALTREREMALSKDVNARLEVVRRP